MIRRLDMRVALICGLLTLLAAVGTSAPAAADSGGIDETFGALFGSWRGKGSIVVTVGEPAEKISCRANYVRASDSAMNVKIRCAGVDYKVNAVGRITYNQKTKMFSGRLEDDELGWTVELTGGHATRKAIRFGLNIEQAEVSGWLNIELKSNRSHTWRAQQSTSSGLKPLLTIGFNR